MKHSVLQQGVLSLRHSFLLRRFIVLQIFCYHVPIIHIVFYLREELITYVHSLYTLNLLDISSHFCTFGEFVITDFETTVHA
jgi:hypothetical protein